MKKMTCRELGGACDQEFLAETPEEMMKKSMEHGSKMTDEAHEQKKEEMRGMMGGDAEKKFMETFHKNFDAAPNA